VDHIFDPLRVQLGERLAALDAADPRERAREGIREYVRFVAAHPDLFRLMVDQGKSDDRRTAWLVERHLKPLYDAIPAAGLGVDERRKPHAHYALVGAASVLFAVAPEARRLTGLDPGDPEVVEAHADFVARLLVP